jgi:hypothetical protein
MSSLCSTVAGMVTPKGSMSTERETLQVSVLPYRCSIAPFCCVCLGCCAAEFGSSGGTYELPCICMFVVYLGTKCNMPGSQWFSSFTVVRPKPTKHFLNCTVLLLYVVRRYFLNGPFRTLQYLLPFVISEGHSLASRHCATRRKVAGSFPDGVIKIFH